MEDRRGLFSLFSFFSRDLDRRRSRFAEGLFDLDRRPLDAPPAPDLPGLFDLDRDRDLRLPLDFLRSRLFERDRRREDLEDFEDFDDSFESFDSFASEGGLFERLRSGVFDRDRRRPGLFDRRRLRSSDRFGERLRFRFSLSLSFGLDEEVDSDLVPDDPSVAFESSSDDLLLDSDSAPVDGFVSKFKRTR